MACNKASSFKRRNKNKKNTYYRSRASPYVPGLGYYRFLKEDKKEIKVPPITMPRKSAVAPFEIYQDPCDRIPAPPRTPDPARAQIDALRASIAEAEKLLTKATGVVGAAREAVAAEQVLEVKEAVKRIRLEKAVKRQEEIAADLEMQIEIVEVGMEYLSHTIGEREEEIGELREEAERLERKLDGVLWLSV